MTEFDLNLEYSDLGKNDGSANPNEPVKPIEPVEPDKPIEPTEPVTPVEPTEPTEPVTPVEASVEINGVLHQINENGEAVDETGQIVLTKEEVEELKNPTPLLIDEIKSKLGFDYKNEKGEVLNFDDSVDGILSLVKESATIIAKQNESKLFEKFPQAKKFVEHLINGGTESNFLNFQKPSFLNVKINEDTSEQEKLNVVVENFLSKGFQKDKAVKMAEMLKQTSDLDKEAEEALKELQEQEITFTKKQEEILKAEKQRQDKEIQEQWNEIGNIIKKGTVLNFNIPEADKSGFLAYISKPIDEKGNTQEMAEVNKENLETSLALSFLRYKKFNLSNLINNAATTQKINNLRDRIGKTHKVNHSDNNATHRNSSKPQNVKDFDITIDNLKF